MSKVPVGASIAHAYGFLFGRFFQIIGTAWVPALLYGLGYYVFLNALQFAKPVPAPEGAVLAAIPALVCLRVLSHDPLGARRLADAGSAGRAQRPDAGPFRDRSARAAAVLRLSALLRRLYPSLHRRAGRECRRRLRGGKIRCAASAGHGGRRQPIAVVAATVLAVVLAIWFVLSMLRLVFLLPPSPRPSTARGSRAPGR
ncbi:MAG: hypothetical protein WDM81_18875 [Rhizomicrobium sp.]